MCTPFLESIRNEETGKFSSLKLFLDIRKKHFPWIKIPNKDVSPKESSDLYYEYVTYILISFYLIKTFICICYTF